MEWVEKKMDYYQLGTGGMWIVKLLELNHVEKSFDGLAVIKDISMSVEEGKSFPSSVLRVPENPPCCAAPPCWRPWTAGK